MCLFPETYPNKKYQKGFDKQGNARIPPPCEHEVLAFITAPCGNCEQCRKQLARDMRVRLEEEYWSSYKKGLKARMVTLTFNPQNLLILSQHKDVIKTEGYERENAICKLAMNLWCDRWKKKFKNRPRRFFVTELGHKAEGPNQHTTEHVHMHGIMWNNLSDEEFRQALNETWGYGYIHWDGKGAGLGSHKYVTKYVFKMDNSHKYWKPKVFASPGIGAGYLTRSNSNKNKFNGENTIETYKNHNGYNMALPIYLRNKILNTWEREQLRIYKEEKGIKYLNGIEFNMKDQEQYINYYIALEHARSHSKKMGYLGREMSDKAKAAEQAHRNKKFWEKANMATPLPTEEKKLTPMEIKRHAKTNREVNRILSDLGRFPNGSTEGEMNFYQ